MPYYGSIEIIDASGWSKSVVLEKTRLSVGSAPFNDIVLSEERGAGVSPAHLQIFYNPSEPCRLRVVNLDRQPVRIQNASIQDDSLADLEETIPGSATGWVEHASRLVVGDFHLDIHLALSSGITRQARSQNLGLALELPGIQLRPKASLDGRLMVTNHGQRPRCQVSLDLDGLPAECYKIEPAPLLYPGGQEYLRISIHHLGTQPPAGPCLITLRASAPKDYPTEEVIIDETLDILPFFGFQLAVVSEPAVKPSPPPAPTPALPPPPAPAVTPEPAPMPSAPAPQVVSAPRVAPPPVISIEAERQPPTPEAAPPVEESPAPVKESPMPEPVAESTAATVVEAPETIPLEQPAPPPESAPARTFISVVAEPATGQDWSADAWASERTAPPRPAAPLSGSGAARLSDLLAGQNVTVMKAGAQDELLDGAPLSPFDEEEEEQEES